MSNYHKIKAFINTVHSYSDTLYGASERTFGLIRINAVKIKNTIEFILNVISKSKENVIQVTSIPVNPNLKINAKIDKNKTYVQQKISSVISLYSSPKESVTKIVNNFVIFISKYLKEEQILKISNSIDHILKINMPLAENESLVKDDPLSSSLLVRLEENNQNIEISNPDVNASAWYFLRLGNISGTLADIPNENLETLGRKKVV